MKRKSDKNANFAKLYGSLCKYPKPCQCFECKQIEKINAKASPPIAFPNDFVDDTYYVRVPKPKRIPERKLKVATPTSEGQDDGIQYVVYDEADLGVVDFAKVEKKLVARMQKELEDEEERFFKSQQVTQIKFLPNGEPAIVNSQTEKPMTAVDLVYLIPDLTTEEAERFIVLEQKFKEAFSSSAGLNQSLRQSTEAIKGYAASIQPSEIARGSIVRGWLCRECSSPADFLYILIERLDYDYPQKYMISMNGFRERVQGKSRVTAETEIFPVCILHDFNGETGMLKVFISEQAKKFMTMPAKLKLDPLPEAGQRHIRLEEKE